VRDGVPREVLRFAITYDYRCPFGRIVHDHVTTALAAGADWEVGFLPFCLGQPHVAEGDAPLWERPDDDSGLLALQASIALRDGQPGAFLGFHRDVYEWRHREAGNLRDRAALSAFAARHGADPDAMWADVGGGGPLATIAREHEGYVRSHLVWGVPTFVVGGAAVFVRLMRRPDGDADAARSAIERIVGMIGWSDLNEFKHTSIPA